MEYSEHALPLRELTCHMESHSVTCHPGGDDIPAFFVGGLALW